MIGGSDPTAAAIGRVAGAGRVTLFAVASNQPDLRSGPHRVRTPHSQRRRALFTRAADVT